MTNNFIDDNAQPPIGIHFANNEIKAINTLNGIIIGMTADGRINEGEINALNIWLLDNEIFCNTFPLNVVKNRIDNILADGIITEDEKTSLYNDLSKIVGGTYKETGSMAGSSTTFGTSEPDRLIFQDSTFCLTGAFITGTRDKCEQIIAKKGGVPVSAITKNLNYLVIGTFASRDWIGTSHGRKIEKAIHYQNKGYQIVILSEETWSKHL